MQIRPFLRGIRLLREDVPDFGRYPFDIPAVRQLDELSFHEGVTFLVGENGMGKSTLMEAIAVVCGFCPEGGGRNFRLETRATHSVLYRYLRPLRGPLSPRDGYFLRAESLYNVATYIDELDEVPAFAGPLSAAYGGSLHERSHGESFFALLCNRLGGDGLYLFDEPEAGLSAQRQLAMLPQMHRLVKAGSQFIIATHSPILPAYPASVIYQLSEAGIRRVSYEETDAYQITRRFLNQPAPMIRQLLQEEETPPPPGG